MRTVKLTNYLAQIFFRQINEFNDGVDKTDLKLPLKLSYALHRNEDEFNRINSKYEKKRQKLVYDYSKKDKDGRPIYVVEDEKGEKLPEPKLQFEKEEELTEKIGTLMQQEVEISFYDIKDVETSIEGFSGDQKVLKQLWYLIDLFNEYPKAKTENDAEENTSEAKSE